MDRPGKTIFSESSKRRPLEIVYVLHFLKIFPEISETFEYETIFKKGENMSKIFWGSAVLVFVAIQGCMTVDGGDLTTSPLTTGTTIVDSVTKNYVETNHELLAEEAAQGKGEHLEALAGLLGCEESNYGAFSQVMQKHHQVFLQDAEFSSKPVFKVLSKAIHTHPELKHSCRKMG